MANMDDKYSVFKLEYLIKQIQKASIKLADPKVKKEMTNTTYQRNMNEIREMRWSVQARLKKLDRSRPEFFPLGTFIEYKHPGSAEKRNGIVEDHEEGYCIVRFEGEVYQTKVEPKFLTLKHLRNTY